MTREEALRGAAGAIGRHVPDLAGLAALLDGAGCARLAAALRAKVRPAEVGGEARPDAEFWSAEAEKVVG